ncbi:Transmembrane amino acid transporter protein [Leishmania donovani]|uniref:Transmembrane amino acid transporter family protein n=1 Tax=Leishmania donovani TaxID=5661 RepID=A0A504Y2P7_LEIDO|nr:Transmembrane amino acid transporter family protein [Leishmania donovani]CAJ1987298.1 Transmembrane amino acid transporter protein [Leishmania donovani]VDZ43187.1 Transmembrane_amino_acid_transporter_protein_putative/Pfam:PF01490 [Leishmania donovani]
MRFNGNSGTAEEGRHSTSPRIFSPPLTPPSSHPMTPTWPSATAVAEQERQPHYSLPPSSPPLLNLTHAADETDRSSCAAGASAGQRYFHTSSLKETEQDRVADSFHHAWMTTPQSKSAGELAPNGTDDCTNPSTALWHRSSGAVQPTSNRDREAANCSDIGCSNVECNCNGGRPLRDEGSGADDLHRAPVVRLTAEEEQAARLRAYNEMVAGAAVGSDAGVTDGVIAANSRDFVSDTLRTILPSGVTQWFSRSVDAVAHTSSSMVPDGVKSAASTVSNTVGVGAQQIGDAIDRLPDLVVNAIPSTVMPDDVKQLFTDFSNTFRSFFHTNILSMPFVFRQAGLIGGIVLLSFVAITSEYATEAYFGAKNQMKNAHKVVLYGEVPLMIWGKWYPMINLFYGVIHLVGFIAFSSSNAAVLLGAMGMKGSSAQALGLILPSLIALPLVLMKNARSQQPLAIMSNTLVLNSVILMCVDFTYKPQPPMKLWPYSPSEFFVALGVTVYAFTGIGSTITVERVMAPQRYLKLLRVSVAISWALLMAFGLSGFVAYGNHTCSVMTVSLKSGPLRTAASALLFLASLTIIPQNTFPLCELSDRRLLGITRLTHYWDIKPNLLRISYLILSASAAFTVPYYGLVLSISGSLGCGIVGLVVPAALDYVRRERWALRKGRTLRFWEYILVFGLGFYGCVVVIIGVVSGSYQLWKNIQTSSPDSC